MEITHTYYAGLDVAQKETAICLMDETGQILQEGVVPTVPTEIDAYLTDCGFEFQNIGLEAGNLSIWLYWQLTSLGYKITPMETKQVNAFLSAQHMKTDRNDARGIAQMIRCNLYMRVHVKSDESQRLKMLLNNRRFLVKQRADCENQIRGSLKTFGLKVGDVQVKRYENKVLNMIAGDGELEIAICPLLEQRRSGLEQIDMLDKILMKVAKTDPVCQLLMTAPGVGPLTAILYKAVIDDPKRFKHSKDVPPHLGLTPKKHASGEVDYNGGITKSGDAMLRNHLYIAATSVIRQSSRTCALKDWGRKLQKRSSYKRATVAVARKLSIILHRMWMDRTEFDWAESKAA